MKFNFFYIIFLIFITGCTSNVEPKKIKVGFSQAMTTDDWRKQMDRSMKIEASLQPNVHLIINDAKNDMSRQISDIDIFIKEKVDIIILSPIQSQPPTDIVKKALDAGIPVLIVDRKIEGDQYTAYLGADNIEVGRNAANYIISHKIGSGKVIEVTGLKGSSPAFERSLGFRQIFESHTGAKIVDTISGNWEAESIRVSFEKALRKNPDTEFVFAHNDRMALGCWEIAKMMGLENKIKFIGVDGLNTPKGGIDLVKKGILEATILYPSGGNEALKLALRILKGDPVATNNTLNTIVIDKINAEIIENQIGKVEQQQSVIESQQDAIHLQEKKYASQKELVQLLSIFLIIILSLAIYSIYSSFIISRKKKELESIHRTVIEQKNEIELMASIASRSNEARLAFFTGLSHEFKTPITLIMSYVSSILQNDLVKGSKLVDEVKLIHNNSNSLLRLINQLLDFRKIEEQKFGLKAGRTDIISFTQDIMHNFKGESIKRNIDYQFNSQVVSSELFIDKNLLEKVYYNLLSNAFKFTPDNGKIAVTIKDIGNEIKIYFKDSGIGIPESELQSVFQPFYKASNNNKNSSGIGLHLSKEFIELHGGNIEAHSKHGAELIITLKKGAAHLDSKDIIEGNDELAIQDFDIQDIILETKSKNAGDTEMANILIIEDNRDLITFLQSRLRDEYEVITSDGTDAIEKALEIIPDAIICDVNLGDKDGFEISKMLKKDLRTSHIPIIILTALDNQESMLKGLHAGVDLYLTKPFSIDILRHSINNILFNREKLRYFYTNNIYRLEPEAKFGFQEQTFITRMNELIAENITKSSFTVEELAEKLNVSRVQLYRKVKAVFGISISDHIHNIKMEKALELLKEGEMNIASIAYSLGYSSPNYFSTTFKNKYGVSPKDYRKI